MKYVPGDTLSVVTQRLHDKSGPQGLRPSELRDALGFTIDLAASLDQYHRGGLWHKDVKPDNIIVHDGRAELVDFGLSPRCACCDDAHHPRHGILPRPRDGPPRVRAWKVHEVNGQVRHLRRRARSSTRCSRGSFPAHGVLSQVTKKSPDALKWIIRRAMADYDNRYDTIGRCSPTCACARRVRPLLRPRRRPAQHAARRPAPTTPPLRSPRPPSPKSPTPASTLISRPAPQSRLANDAPGALAPSAPLAPPPGSARDPSSSTGGPASSASSAATRTRPSRPSSAPRARPKSSSASRARPRPAPNHPSPPAPAPPGPRGAPPPSNSSAHANASAPRSPAPTRA